MDKKTENSEKKFGKISEKISEKIFEKSYLRKLKKKKLKNWKKGLTPF